MVTTLMAAARSFRSDRAFAVAIVATIALGFAPTCMVFTLMDSLYFRPLPYPEQHRLALLNTAHPSTASLDEIDPFTFQEWRHKTTAIVTAAVYRSASFALNDGDRPELVPGQYVTADFFRTLGAMPAIGRAPTAADCAPGAPRVVVISDRFWREYFAHRDGIIGSVVRVDGVPATIVGVMPAGFVSFMEGRAARVWTPLARDNETTPSDARGGNAIVRLQNTSSLAQAQAELESVRTTLARQYPEFYRDRALVLRDFRASLFGGLGPGIRVLSVMVGVLLLIACGNAANLLLARAARCTREVAIRSALGASRLRLIGASLAESVALTSVAAVLGLVLAWAGSRLLWSATAPIFRDIGVDGLPVDWRAVAFTFLLALVTALLTGLWPSFRGSRTDLVAAFGDSSRGTGRTSGRGRMSRALVVGQVALCVLTMVGATLVTENVIRFLRASTEPGFRPEALTVASLPRPGDSSPSSGHRMATLEEVERRIEALPGVARVALTDRVPFIESGRSTPVFARAKGEGEVAGERIDVQVRTVDADFFAVMSIPIRRGRSLSIADHPNGLPVVVIDDRLARARWTDTDAIGDRLLVDGTWRIIVGIAGSTIHPSPFRPSARELFVPYRQARAGDATLIIESARPGATLAPAIRREVRAVDPDQPVLHLETMTQALSRFMTPFRLIFVLVLLFATIALGLAAVGLYGVVAHDVSRRTREFGVRAAFGAGPAVILGVVLRDGFRLTAIGVAIGLVPGLALTKVLPSGILGTRDLAPNHFVAILLVGTAVALAACVVPARRAARLDPLSALRHE